MELNYLEVKCGNCRHWLPWESFAVKGVISKRRAVEKGNQTGCDGKCCCYYGTEQENKELNPRARNSWDTVTPYYCKFYTPERE